jgi:hypothetical protein
MTVWVRHRSVPANGTGGKIGCAAVSGPASFAATQVEHTFERLMAPVKVAGFPLPKDRPPTTGHTSVLGGTLVRLQPGSSATALVVS